MKIRKNISLDEKVLDRALDRANILFGGNLSAYLTYLINKDTIEKNEEKYIRLEENKNNQIGLAEEVSDSLDDILGGDII